MLGTHPLLDEKAARVGNPQLERIRPGGGQSGCVCLHSWRELWSPGLEVVAHEAGAWEPWRWTEELGCGEATVLLALGHYKQQSRR